MVMSKRYGGQEGDSCHGHIVVPWRRERLEEKGVSFFIYF